MFVCYTFRLKRLKSGVWNLVKPCPSKGLLFILYPVDFFTFFLTLVLFTKIFWTCFIYKDTNVLSTRVSLILSNDHIILSETRWNINIVFTRQGKDKTFKTHNYDICSGDTCYFYLFVGNNRNWFYSIRTERKDHNNAIDSCALALK